MGSSNSNLGHRVSQESQSKPIHYSEMEALALWCRGLIAEFWGTVAALLLFLMQ
jgi:hypothetical protein